MLYQPIDYVMIERCNIFNSLEPTGTNIDFLKRMIFFKLDLFQKNIRSYV